jgi:hypothetical protein
LAAVALDCCRLLTSTKTIIFFPEKEKKKRQKKEKKDMQSPSNGAAAVKVFWIKILPAGWRFFFKNLQSLTFTAGKRNC